jgi:NADH-quinone oxidoreductase subunit L
MNLFIGSMLMLVLAGNLLFLYLGWEAVGLCSYLLIGFWYKDPANGYAARKAFIVTRVGDTLMAIGLFLLIKHMGTLDIQNILTRLPEEFSKGAPMIVAASALLLGGAVGKSAQLPMQVWLPDAMAGPSPVSALIHAATMVTAGVYLIARTFVLFEMAPAVQMLVAIIGAITLLLGGFSALTQSDIKKVLAYSTISQIGYMFLALGVGAWSAAVFHFMTHAFFKALLFLGAGVIILRLQHEHDIFKMGGLRKSMPWTFWTFLAGAASLAALPLITAGFYSKDTILWYSWISGNSGVWLWIIGIVGSFLTALYTFRMVFITFYGEEQMKPTGATGNVLKIPLVVLAVLSIIGGFINLPENFGHHLQWLSGFLHQTLPELQPLHQGTTGETFFQIISGVVVLLGIFSAYTLYYKPATLPQQFRKTSLHRYWMNGWAFDELYDSLFVKPVVWLARVDKRDVIDYINIGLVKLNVWLHHQFSRTQTGRLRYYSMGIALGVLVAIVIIIFG